jgi:hypothetical protein
MSAAGEEPVEKEPDFEVLLLMLVAFPLCGALCLRAALVRRLGRVAGNLIGAVPVALLGAFPLASGCLLILVIRLLGWLLSLLDRPRSGGRAANPFWPSAATACW